MESISSFQIIAAVLAKFLPVFSSLQTCQTSIDIFRDTAITSGSDFTSLEPYYGHGFSSYSGEPIALLGLKSAFNGPVQNELYMKGLGP